ncbi:MAG: glycosyltransferase family 4 protein [Candidatus Acidiferrales bacterium]
MPDRPPSKVLITGGHEVGGVASVVECLSHGFDALGIPSEITSPSRILSRWHDLRDANVLKILSTTAVFAAPLARRAICVAHGIARVDLHQSSNINGWLKLAGFVTSFKVANASSGARLISVSHYTAVTLRAVFNVQSDGVVHNPLRSLYWEPDSEIARERCYITYVGRLVRAKNLHRLIPAIRDLLDETPGLRACIIGTGAQRAELEAMIAGDARFEFKGSPDDATVRDWLRRTRVFVSGNEVEGFGITYLEALSQGCAVAMPASGGGIEIALDQVGKRVHLLPLSWDRAEVTAVLRRALDSSGAPPMSLANYSSEAVARAYLAADSRFFSGGAQ